MQKTSLETYVRERVLQLRSSQGLQFGGLGRRDEFTCICERVPVRLSIGVEELSSAI